MLDTANWVVEYLMSESGINKLKFDTRCVAQCSSSSYGRNNLSPPTLTYAFM